MERLGVGDREDAQEAFSRPEVVVANGGVVFLSGRVENVNLRLFTIEDHSLPVGVGFGRLVVLDELQHSVTNTVHSRTSAGKLPTRMHGDNGPYGQSTAVPRRSHHSSHRSCIATSATFRQPTPAHCASLSTQHVRSSGFSVAGPTVWNTLPDELRDPACDVDSFKQLFKTIWLALTTVTSALEVNFIAMRSTNSRFNYLLYLLTHGSRICQIRRIN